MTTTPNSSHPGFAAPGWSDDLTPGPLHDPARWHVVRGLFPLRSNVIHFDTATLGSVPRPALDQLGRADLEHAEQPRDPYAETALTQVRAELAASYRCEPDEIAVTGSGSDAMSRILGGLALEPGDEIVTTTHECYTVRAPLNILANRRGIRVRRLTPRSEAGLDAEEIVSLFERAITPRTRVLQWAAVSLTTGVTFPTRQLAELAQRRGLISVVDGSLLPGQVDLDLHELGVDFLGGSLAKYQCAPMGTGLIYARNRVLPDFNPAPLPEFWPVVSLAYPAEGTLPQRTGDQEPAYDLGAVLQHSDTADLSRAVALRECLRIWERLGQENVQWYVFGLGGYLKERIISIWGRDALCTPADDDRLHSGIVAFRPFKRGSAEQYQAFRDRLAADQGMHVQIVRIPVPTAEEPMFAVRMSVHLYNTEAEIDKALDVMVLLREGLEAGKNRR
ncbi:aminotransferase class V-fold PLP-dependent enzyme [Actinoplanes sp. NPDC023801]|uniref:aminotransferase class V-fold PLP-dependent enzyme n=1 Tax=Actinoplanes sp. NPDC023801 TaxID=3154595 RepID=UPI0033EF2030